VVGAYRSLSSCGPSTDLISIYHSVLSTQSLQPSPPLLEHPLLASLFPSTLYRLSSPSHRFFFTGCSSFPPPTTVPHDRLQYLLDYLIPNSSIDLQLSDSFLTFTMSLTTPSSLDINQPGTGSSIIPLLPASAYMLLATAAVI
jgi:hypothetical protein